MRMVQDGNCCALVAKHVGVEFVFVARTLARIEHFIEAWIIDVKLPRTDANDWAYMTRTKKRLVTCIGQR